MKFKKNFFKVFVYFLPAFFALAQSQSFYISPVRLTNNCSDKEVFTNCGSACDLTCENVTTVRRPNNYEPYVVLDEPDCKYNCIPGCFCRKPLYRNRFGECVEEEQCKKNFNRDDFIGELNKFLNLNFNNDLNSPNAKNVEYQPSNRQTNQKYIAVNDNSESILNPRTGYHPKNLNHQNYQNYQNFFNLEKDFLNNFFDDIFNAPKQQTRQTTYNNNNYNSNFKTTNDDSLEKQIEREADIIIQRLSNGLKIKKFIIDTIRSLVNRSQYSGLGLPSFNDQKEETKNGLITTK